LAVVLALDGVDLCWKYLVMPCQLNRIEQTDDDSSAEKIGGGAKRALLG
jgi:hypothetical protein